ncbi:MAG: hypothetical protein QM765_25770 [Myxococcales bacterium]
MKGKMSYLAPEIVSGTRPLPASDQFACGSVLWEALVGRKLFDGATDYDTYTRLREGIVPPLRPLRSDVPAPFAQIIRAAVGEIESRFRSTREMARQIGTALKKVQLRKDLHTVLARSVAEAREAQGIGPRAQEASEATPIAEMLPEMAEVVALPGAPKGGAIGGIGAVGAGMVQGVQGAMRGLRHYLPFFGKKK